jgi:hypothetical protein
MTLTLIPHRATIATVRRLVMSIVIAAIALLGASASAFGREHAHRPIVALKISGWGSVKLGKGAVPHRTISCNATACRDPSLPPLGSRAKGSRFIVTEKPSKGWKFGGWVESRVVGGHHGGAHGICRRRRKCVITRIGSQTNDVYVTARFIPTAPGLTRGNPIPLGTTASVDDGQFTVRVNSELFYVQLSPPPTCGCEYFAVNATLTNTSSVEEDPGSIGWGLTPAPPFPATVTYTQQRNPCPYPGKQPALDLTNRFSPGESATGYVCWTVTVNDADELVLSFASGIPNWNGSIWFALH